MVFEKLKQSISKYCDINQMINAGLGINDELISDTVILAPWWKPEVIFANSQVKIEQLTYEMPQVYQLTFKNKTFTYIRTGIGAPVCAQVALTLGFSKCKQVIFIGSVGSLSKNISIGTVVVPKISICGEGFSAYLNEEIDNSSFGKESYANSNLREKILKIAEKNKINTIKANKGNEGFEIYDGFKPLPGEKIFDKNVNSAFRGTGLLEYLKDKKEEELIITGLATDYCMDATIKCGFEHGFRIIVPAGTNSTFDNEFMTGEQSYKYYNEFMWNERYAKCIPLEEALKVIARK